MATGGFRAPNTATDFLEEWKAKREKMRAKMLGELAVSGSSTGSGSNTVATTSSVVAARKNNNETVSRRVVGASSSSSELNNNGNPDRGVSSTFNCVSVSSQSMVRSPSSSALRKIEDDPQQAPAGRGADPAGGNLAKKVQSQPEKLPGTPQAEGTGNVCSESDKESTPSPAASSKGKEKSKSSGPSARKGKGQIDKRKLREKRRSTGVVNIPCESPDEFDDDNSEHKERTRENTLTQQNTVQNEVLASDPSPAHLLQDTPRAVTSKYKSSAAPVPDDEVPGNSKYSARTDRTGHTRNNREQNPSGTVPGRGLEKIIEELERELAKERQESAQLMKAHQDKDELIGKLKEEIDLLNRDLDDIEDENEQLKHENKTLLKVVGQLTR
ncbi:PRKC apoptosis WT1 regulator protein-like [Acipenser ruthenus]|uniref:PRKC apoptosis WT1 regulator protein-like n=1 Tax=Acipenser ruthenus TaxID=7906 RepID=UPI00145B2401|nr:PRKC apoptosis WT1 regulator protein-like [Acipenser ruthenus]